MIIIKTILFLLALFYTFMFIAEIILKGFDTIKNKRTNTIKSVIPAVILWTIFYLINQL